MREKNSKIMIKIGKIILISGKIGIKTENIESFIGFYVRILFFWIDYLCFRTKILLLNLEKMREL
jgi:hypothetical protein